MSVDRGRALSLVALTATALVGLGACKKGKPPDDDPEFKGPKVIRAMKKAGSWYARDAKQLGKELDRNLVGAALPALDGPLVGLVSPHAGYRFSGPTAAYGFKLLGKQRGVKRVVVMGLSHHHLLRGVSIPAVTHYETPFGLLRVDRKAARKLLAEPVFETVEAAHSREHSVEMQMPYLKRVRPSVKIVPMLVGRLDAAQRRQAAVALSGLVDGQTVFVASSDFTHRGGGFRYEVPRREGESLRDAVKRMDFGLLPAIRGLDGEGLLAYHRRTRITVCGRAPIALMLDALRIGQVPVSVKVLHYTTSGDVLGDWSQTVSYLSVALTRRSK